MKLEIIITLLACLCAKQVDPCREREFEEGKGSTYIDCEDYIKKKVADWGSGKIERIGKTDDVCKTMAKETIDAIKKSLGKSALFGLSHSCIKQLATDNRTVFDQVAEEMMTITEDFENWLKKKREWICSYSGKRALDGTKMKDKIHDYCYNTEYKEQHLELKKTFEENEARIKQLEDQKKKGNGAVQLVHAASLVTITIAVLVLAIV